jgi:hypothetical protein
MLILKMFWNPENSVLINRKPKKIGPFFVNFEKKNLEMFGKFFRIFSSSGILEIQ